MLFVASAKAPQKSTFDASQICWAPGSTCAMHQRHFSLEMLIQEFPPDASGEAVSKNVYTESTLLHAAQRLGFRVKTIALKTKYCAALPRPLLVNIAPPLQSQDTTDNVAVDNPIADYGLALEPA